VHLPRVRQQIEAFRAALNSQNYGVEGLEKQQRELRDRIPPIHDAVRNKLKAHIKTDAGVSLQGQTRRKNESGD